MKKILTLLAAVVSLCFLANAQVPLDIQIQQIGPYIDLARGQAWSVTGTGGINNNFVVSMSSPPVNGACVFISNNDANPHSIAIGGAYSADPRVTQYQGNVSRWLNLPQSAPANFNGTLIANGIGYIQFMPSNAARLVISVSGGAGTGTADLFMSLGPCGAPMNGAYSSYLAGLGNGSVPLLQCGHVSSQTVAAGATVTLVSAQPVQSLVFCSIMIDVSAAITTASTVLFQRSASPSICSGLATLFTTYPPGLTVGLSKTWGTNTGFLFGPGLQNSAVCVTNNSTGGSIQVSFTYDFL